MIEEDDCATCKYEHKTFSDYPCVDCQYEAGFYWKPKEPRFQMADADTTSDQSKFNAEEIGKSCGACHYGDYSAGKACEECRIDQSEQFARWRPKEGEIYCPICARIIVACNLEEVESGVAEGYVFVHDEIIHEDSDLDALAGGIN